MSRQHRRLDARRWAAVRREVLDRDGWRCRTCGGYGNEVDHIESLQSNPEQDPYDPAGLQTLCRTHHIEKTRRENRREPTPAEAEWHDFVAELTGLRSSAQ